MDYDMTESPDTIHGRMKEGAHIAGYSLQRSIENLRWLLEDSRFEQLSAGYKDVNEFLRDSDKAFSLVNIKPEERKQIAELVKELQPKASQRAIADMVGAGNTTIARDLGWKERVSNETPIKERHGEKDNERVSNETPTFPPAIPPDDYDPIKLMQAKQQREISHSNKIMPPPMEGKYRVIYADPPWAYDNTGFDQSAEAHYPTMTINELETLPIHSLADSPSVLYLWATVPILPDALYIMDAWGFEYKTHRIWKKDRAPGIGWWAKTYHELLLVGTANGNYHPSEKLPSVIELPVTDHSTKPDQFANDIMLCHEGPYIELFARRQRDGWDLWGNEDV